MLNKYQKFRKSRDLIVTFCGGLLISLPAIPLVAAAQETGSKLNPCPRIFYEEPHNSQILVPQGCPPNAYTQQINSQPTTSPTLPSTTPSGVIQPPLPETQQPPRATIIPRGGKVVVKLVNITASPISYQVIGDTKPRVLEGKSDVVLQGLATPTTVTFRRQDGGLLRVTPAVTANEPDMLQVTLEETTDLGVDKSAMTIQPNGSVFLN
jgi:hypothetical protein